MLSLPEKDSFFVVVVVEIISIKFPLGVDPGDTMKKKLPCKPRDLKLEAVCSCPHNMLQVNNALCDLKT